LVSSLGYRDGISSTIDLTLILGYFSKLLIPEGVSMYDRSHVNVRCPANHYRMGVLYTDTVQLEQNDRREVLQQNTTCEFSWCHLQCHIGRILVLMPMPMLWGLSIPLARKIGLVATFSLGAVICVIGVLRVLYVPKIDFSDFTYGSAVLWEWAVLEPTLGIINACMPVMLPVIREL
ncbi:hypothetical protein BDV96DRAFT_675588, partial [Lophiotrema nucula]